MNKKYFFTGLGSILLGSIYIVRAQGKGEIVLSGGRILSGQSFYIVVSIWFGVGIYFLYLATKAKR